MTVIYNAAIKTGRMEAVNTGVNNGGAGKIQIYDAGSVTLLAEFDLDAVAGVVTADVLNLSSFPKTDPSANNTGTGAEAKIIDGTTGDAITGLTVGATGSGEDVEINPINITQTQPVTLNSAAITHF